MRGVVTLVAIACGAACSSDGGAGDPGPSYADAHPRIYLEKSRDRLAHALAAGTPAAQRFRDVVDRWVGGEDIWGFPPWYAALLGQLDGNPKYCAAAVAAVDQQVKDAETAAARGEPPEVAGDSYLEVGDAIGSLALVYDWCYDAVGTRRQAWLAYANQAVSNVWHHDSASWNGHPMPWTGWAVDDPADNYYYSFLRATMLLGLAAHGELPGSDDWLAQFRDVKLREQLVPMFDRDLVGGGSREGTGYGVAMRRLFELYDIWQQSTGEDIASDTPHTRASMLDFIHATVPTLDRIAPTGDQSRDSTASFFDYHRNYLQELVALYPKDPLAPRAQALLAASSVPEMSQGFMVGYDFLYDSGVAPSSLDGLGRTYYAPGTGQLYARSGWDTHATWINLIAGPYTESHAHQDQGAIMIYKDGWLAYDAVIDSHSGLRQEVGAHSTLRIGDLEQQPGTSAQLVALHRGNGYVYAAADLAPVYGGAVATLQREIVYLEPDCVVIRDRASTGSAPQVWQLAVPAAPQISGTRAQVAANGHVLSIERLAPAGASSAVHDYTEDSDFSGGFRLDETASGGDQRWLHVAWIDGAVGTVTSVDGNTVDVVLSGGHHAHVAFSASGPGATLALDSATITLGSGVESMPE